MILIMCLSCIFTHIVGGYYVGLLAVASPTYGLLEFINLWKIATCPTLCMIYLIFSLFWSCYSLLLPWIAAGYYTEWGWDLYGGE